MKKLPLNERLAEWLGKKGVRYFQLLHSFHRGIPLVIRLNQSRKGMSAHPIHFREGMQIRNWMRDQPEYKNLGQEVFDDMWIPLLVKAIGR